MENFDFGCCFWVDELTADLEIVKRHRPMSYSVHRMDCLASLLESWRVRLLHVDPKQLTPAGRVDLQLMRNHLRREASTLEIQRELRGRLDQEMPFGKSFESLEEMRIRRERPIGSEVAKLLSKVDSQIQSSTNDFEDELALSWGEECQESFQQWVDFYRDYDPELHWWTSKPIQTVQSSLSFWLERAQQTLRSAQSIPGRPIGRDALQQAIHLELIDHTPEELIAIGEAQYKWCLKEVIAASRDLGFQDDWKAALEAVKETAVAPGLQPKVVDNLAQEAIRWVEERDLVTVPELAKQTWRMSMMSREKQKVNPFFLGGETIVVSYPTVDMTDEEKRMSMRGNNPNFSRATVQHELIPGHHLQLFMTDRHRKYRRLFGTPFWIEGWTLYWELLLWELGFPQTPEQRIGMLFWRMHRCVRIVFSLRFHLGELSTQDCVEMLVDRVGHERANAEGEVRRSFNGRYPPLYQAAYMLGGLMFMQSKRELVGSGRMTIKQFHDEILLQNELPPTIMRSWLRGEFNCEFEAEPWKFEPSLMEF